MAKLNILVIFVFLNIWDFVINGTLFNGMVMGAFLFGPAALLWFAGSFRAIALMTLISILESCLLAVFVIEGFEIAGGDTSLKWLFWVPYLVMAVLNGFLGLRAYWQQRQKKHRD